MNTRQAIQSADPARHLAPQRFDARDEQLLHEILASPSPAGTRQQGDNGYRAGRRGQQWRPVLVTAATAIVLLVLSLSVLHLADRGTAPADPNASPGRTLIDPLQEITDRSSQMYVADDPKPILHIRADRSGTFALDIPAGTTSVRFYFVCAAGSTWSLRTDTIESGTCRGHIDGYSETPAAQLRRSVQVTVAPRTPYVLLAIPTPEEESAAPQAPIEIPLLPYPSEGAPAGDELIGRARASTNDRVVGEMTATAHSLYVVISCQGTGTIVISTQDGFTAGSPGDSPNSKICGATHAITSSYGDNDEGGMEHYGHMQYAIQPIGNVTWTVSFYNAH